MGELIVLAERLADRSRPAGLAGRPAFFFSLACPFSYLAAERVERVLGEVDWIPAARLEQSCAVAGVSLPQFCHEAERRAAELRLPLVWPDGFPEATPSALRAAAYAIELGAGARFVLAASRLAFCGGFDLEDPEILAEAAAAAGIPLEPCLAAARDRGRDAALEATGRGLATRGVGELPAVRVGRRWLSGERAVTEAAALVQALAAEGRPLAPAG
jgi:2-hydroxychromene-2-carboxylate isomerase